MEVSRTNDQVLSNNDYIIFNDTIVVPPSRCMYYNQNTGITTLYGKTNSNCYALFRVTFTADLSSTAATTPASLAITADGADITKSEMQITSTAIGDTYNVARTMYIKVPKGMSTTVGVQSTATTNETVSNAVLIIERVS